MERAYDSVTIHLMGLQKGGTKSAVPSFVYNRQVASPRLRRRRKAETPGKMRASSWPTTYGRQLVGSRSLLLPGPHTDAGQEKKKVFSLGLERDGERGDGDSRGEGRGRSREAECS